MAQVILHWMDGWRLGGLHFDLGGFDGAAACLLFRCRSIAKNVAVKWGYGGYGELVAAVLAVKAAARPPHSIWGIPAQHAAGLQGKRTYLQPTPSLPA